MRGDSEQRCLNIILNDKEINNPRNYFGLIENDIEEVINSLKKAKPNEKLSNFPDFIFDDGFIEHFKVTSSKENKKGSVHIKEISNFNKSVEIEAKKLKEKWSNELNSEKLHSKHWTMKYPNHNYEYFCESFKKSFINHIESMEKYTGNKEISIFMIEYSDLALTMYENVFEDWINGLSNGDMREPELVEFYRISRDKNILNYIYSFKSSIKYIIFVYGKKYEVIKLDNIPYILKLMPWNYVIAPYMNTMLVSSLYEVGKLYPHTEGDIYIE